MHQDSIDIHTSIMKCADQPVVTIVIPTYNRSELLSRAIKSAQLQTYQNIRILISDNASTDNTFTVAQSHMSTDFRIKYFKHERNIGSVNNFVESLKLFNSKYFVFLSDDDFLLPNFIETALGIYNQYPDLVFVALQWLEMDSSDLLLYPANSVPQGLYTSPEGLKKLIDIHHFYWGAILFDYNAVQSIGLNLNAGAILDMDLQLRLAARANYYVSSNYGAVFSIHSDSLTSKSKLSTYWPGIAITFREVEEVLVCDLRARDIILDAFNLKIVSILKSIAIGAVVRRSDADVIMSLDILSNRYGARFSALFIGLIYLLTKKVRLVFTILNYIHLARRVRRAKRAANQDLIQQVRLFLDKIA